ncbi:MAG: response regulator [Acidimicrobiia bacterium]|nr:response regulator [Acidimicrobiia bacterium]
MTELLLVADLPWVDDAVRAALGGTGYALRTIEDPAAAATTWEEQRPPLVLIDLQIGARGGMAVVRDLRAAAQWRGVKPPATVLLLDRYVDAFLARRAGADAWIRKPFGAFELRRLLDRLAQASVADPAEA